MSTAAAKRKRLESFTDAEAAFIAIKAKVAMALAERRRERFTLMEAAKLIGASQARVARMEEGDPAASLDHLVRALLALGASTGDLIAALAHRAAKPVKPARAAKRAARRR